MTDFDTPLVLSIWNAVEERLGPGSPSNQKNKKKTDQKQPRQEFYFSVSGQPSQGMSAFLHSLDYVSLLCRIESKYTYTLRYTGGYSTEHCTTHSFRLEPFERSE